VLRLGSLGLLGLLLWRTQEIALAQLHLPGDQRRFTGSYPLPNVWEDQFPVVSWLNDRTPQVKMSQWKLRVDGEVERPLELAYEELAPETSLSATLDCTGGWYATHEWKGVPFTQLLERAGVKPTAASVTVTSLTGYYRRFSLAEVQELLLATHVGETPLSPGHGFPLRLVSPGQRGFQWVKWVHHIRVNDTSKFWQPPLPLS
jgi:DMSO/TMAO reductase YedYZ molybdopterin-dependent catalytic subunit